MKSQPTIWMVAVLGAADLTQQLFYNVTLEGRG